MLRQVATRIPGSQLVVVPEAGHNIQWEQPAAFNEAVLSFIRGK
jgi:pimeloyl-ACP methyl ester carboxylesterase